MDQRVVLGIKDFGEPTFFLVGGLNFLSKHMLINSDVVILKRGASIK